MGDTHPTPAENTDPVSARLEGLVPTDPGNDIHDRMRAMNEEHIAMGARLAVEPSNGDLYEASLPLREVGTKNGKTIVAGEPAKAPAKPATRAKKSTKAKKSK